MLPRAGMATSRRERLSTELDGIVERLSALPAVRKVIVFGSLAEERVSSASDIDVIVVMDTDKRFMERLDELYRAAASRVALDILAYTPDEFARMKTHNSFVRTALENGKVLYEAE
jgi:predicted nucleotidyltransferase